MTVIIVRIILLLLPLIGVIYFLRWRYRLKVSGEEASDEDIVKVRTILITIFVSLLLLGLLLRFFDTTTTDRDKIYVPPHVENGKMVPAEYIDRPKAEKSQKKPKPENQE